MVAENPLFWMEEFGAKFNFLAHVISFVRNCLSKNCNFVSLLLSSPTTPLVQITKLPQSTRSIWYFVRLFFFSVYLYQQTGLHLKPMSDKTLTEVLSVTRDRFQSTATINGNRPMCDIGFRLCLPFYLSSLAILTGQSEKYM